MASNCLRRCLRPSSGSPSVREAFCDRFVNGHEELPGRLAHAFAQEFPQPCLNLILLGVMGADVRGEIWDLFFRVTKGIKSRVVFDAKVGGRFPGNGRDKWSSRTHKYLAAEELEIDKSYAVSEDVVYPPDIDWFGRHFKPQADCSSRVNCATQGLLSPAVFKKGCVIGTCRDSKGPLEQLGFAMWSQPLDSSTAASSRDTRPI